MVFAIDQKNDISLNTFSGSDAWPEWHLMLAVVHHKSVTANLLLRLLRPLYGRHNKRIHF